MQFVRIIKTMTEKEVSILLPSLRKDLVNQRIAEWATNNPTVNYELIIVSPFEVSGYNVTWLKENDRKGSVHATNIALNTALGNYIIYFSDDVAPTKNCLRHMLDFMKAQEKHPFLGAFKMIFKNNRQIGPFGAYNRLYACYGCISKEDLFSLSNILFRPEFLYSWGDIDLSLRIWEKDGEVKICEEAVVIPQQVEDDIYLAHRNTFKNDFETFANKWHKKLGAGMERKDGAINRRLKLELK